MAKPLETCNEIARRVYEHQVRAVVKERSP